MWKLTQFYKLAYWNAANFSQCLYTVPNLHAPELLHALIIVLSPMIGTQWLHSHIISAGFQDL